MSDKSIAEQIDDIITVHPGWKADRLTELRQLITHTDPSIKEEVKWKMATRPEGLPVWSSNGIVCFAEIWKDNIKLLFPKGAQLKDSDKQFNSRLNSKTTRAIEFKETDKVNSAALKGLVLQAIKLNQAK